MIAIFLCAGFATRMHPLTKDFPKPLLPVAGKPVLDYLMEQVIDLPRLRGIHLVSNARFFAHFERWGKTWAPRTEKKNISIHIYNDGATSNENRLGASGDLRFVFQRISDPFEGCLVSAGDNIFRFPLEPIWRRFLESGHHHIPALPETDPEKLRRTGVLVPGEDGRVLKLHEKPVNPPSTWTCPALYLLGPSARPRLDAFLQTSGDRDAPGHFMAYLCQKEAVYAYKLNASRLDIGNLASYREADRLLAVEPAVTASSRLDEKRGASDPT
ncbi:MAG: nucleotidyltransferase family protein [Desulfobacterales bacterium]|nr:nucleotidyltransferase family protein [Desulfobacterales bacterium]